MFRAAALLSLMMVSLMATAAEGLISLKSPHSPTATMDNLETIVEEKGLKVFARIDHAKGAQSVGESLRPTELLIFGNPQGGTSFMQCSQTVGIDLPLKALVWEDDSGQVWLGYNDPQHLADRHGVADCPVVKNLSGALENMTKAAVAP